MHSPVEVTAAGGVAEVGRGQEGPEWGLCGDGCERLELPRAGRAQRFTPVTLPRNRVEGKHVTPHLVAPQESCGRTPMLDAPHRGCTQPFVRGGYYALNFLQVFDLVFYEEL